MLPLLLACAHPTEIDRLHLEVAMLDARVAALEAGAAGGTAVPGVEAEAAARALFQEAQAALEASDFPTAKARLKAILDLYAATRVGAAAERMYAEVSVVGTTAPEVAVEKWYAGTGAWSDAPVTLVVFFETWCPHCQNEMPRAEAMYERWRPLGLGVVGFTRVTKSASDDTVRSFISEHHLTFPVGKEQAGTLSAAFSVSGIPAAAVVKDGVIVWRGHPARLTDNLLRQYLGA